MQAIVHSDVSTKQDAHQQDDARAVDVRNVIIVDEACVGRSQLEREFRTLGIDSHSVSDLRAAGPLALKQRPDLVVLELGPMASRGLRLVQLLRHKLPETAVVVTTSYASVAIAVQAIRCGAAHYLCKPVKARFILNAIGSSDADVPSEEDSASAAVMTLDQAVWEYLHQVVEMSGSVSEAARRLGLWRQSLRRMMTKYRP